MSIRSKIILLFTSLTVVIVLLLSVLIYLFTAQYLEEDFFQRMKVRAGIAGQARYEVSDRNISFYNEIRDKHLQLLPDEKEYFFDTATSATIRDSLKIILPEFFEQQLARNKIVKHREKDIYYVISIYEHEGVQHKIALSARNQQGTELLYNLRKNLLTGFLISVSVVIIISILLAKEIINPIRNIIVNTKKITASNLHLRLPSKKGSGEIDDLTQTYNDMLDRLETSFETQSNFLNKAAHELRTPLTAIIGEAELALSKSRHPDEYAKALQVIAREAEQLKHHTSSLLELAQAGYISKEPFMNELRMDELLFSVKRLVDFTDPDNNVQMDFDHLPEIEEQLTISGNLNLLKLALANIIQNACKYSDQRKVWVSLYTTTTHCIVTVKDEGIGIPEKELKYIFDPFFRASNTHYFKGYGIGLPLTQKIIRLHRGELHYDSKENAGTTVKVSIPSVKRHYSRF